MMLATLDIDWPLAEDGKPTPFEPEWSFRGQAYVPSKQTRITGWLTLL